MPFSEVSLSVYLLRASITEQVMEICKKIRRGRVTNQGLSRFLMLAK